MKRKHTKDMEWFRSSAIMLLAFLLVTSVALFLITTVMYEREGIERSILEKDKEMRKDIELLCDYYTHQGCIPEVFSYIESGLIYMSTMMSDRSHDIITLYKYHDGEFRSVPYTDSTHVTTNDIWDASDLYAVALSNRADTAKTYVFGQSWDADAYILYRWVPIAANVDTENQYLIVIIASLASVTSTLPKYFIVFYAIHLFIIGLVASLLLVCVNGVIDTKQNSIYATRYGKVGDR